LTKVTRNDLILTKENIFLAGMPELLFRSKFAQHITNASILTDLHSLYVLVEDHEFYLENKKKHELNMTNYINNFILSDQDFLLNSGLYFNSGFFRSSYTLALLKELSTIYEDLVLISDPLTTHHLRDILKKEKEEEKMREMEIPEG
jgi:hypothetical protein